MRPRRTAKKPADARTLLAYATWLLGRQEYSRAQLAEKFAGRFVPHENLFEESLDKLVELGLQHDERAAQSVVSSHPGWGRQRLSLELRRRGIADDIIDSVLPQDDDELTRATETLQKKLRGDPPPEEFKEKQKLIAFLARRGFSLGVAKDALANVAESERC